MEMRVRRAGATLGVASVEGLMAWQRWGALVDLIMRIFSGLAWKGA